MDNSELNILESTPNTAESTPDTVESTPESTPNDRILLSEQVIHELQKKYKPASIKQIQTSLNTLSKHIRSEISGELTISTLENAVLISSLIEKMPIPVSAKRLLIWAIEAILATQGKIYAEYDKIWKKYIRLETEEQYSKDRVISDITLMDIENKIETSKDEVSKLIVSLYAYMPALRGEEWVSLRLWNSQDDLKENWINIEQGYIVIHQYKTMKTYGVRKIPVPTELLKIIRKYCATHRGTFMIMNGNDEMSTKKFEYILKRELGISTTELRRIYISSVVPHLTKVERLKLSILMGHSMEMQEFVYKGKEKEANTAVLNRLREIMQ